MTFQSGAAELSSRVPPSLSSIGIRSFVTSTDNLVAAMILLLGVLAFAFPQRASDFVGEDVFYADCARSLMVNGMYGINGHPETNQPPGLSLILAIVFTAFSYSYAGCLRTITMFEILGFLASYALLRRHLSKKVAGTICLLLMSSQIYFQVATQLVSPCYPVFFTSMLALVAFEEYENASKGTSMLVWGVILTVSVTASLMIASAAMALLVAMIAASGARVLKNRRLGLSRVRRFIPVVIVGVVAQGLWMHREPVPLEWPLPGYPAPYLQQLKVKSGNYPELGMATARDIPIRIAKNLLAQSDLLTGLVLRHGVNESKVAVVIAPVLLIAAGWGYSLWQTGGAGLLGWYFAGYEFIYLLWPWGVEQRFFLPIAPLACFYAWKGLEGIRFMAEAKPRILGLLWCPVAILLTVSGARWVFAHLSVSAFGRFPDELLVPIWLVSAVWAARLAYTGRPPSILTLGSRKHEWLTTPIRHRGVCPLRLGKYAVVAMIILVGVIGLAMQGTTAYENIRVHDLVLTRDTAINPMALEIEGALWIRSHSPSTSIVMARHVPTVYHYAERRLVWFPPSSNPEILMQGILRHNVNYVIVIKHRNPYYLPDDDYCFDKLLAEHADTFRLVFQDSDLRILEVGLPGARLIV